MTSSAAAAWVRRLPGAATRPVRRAVALSAKKKKGPAGSFDLDALEAMEALYDGTPAAAAAAPAATALAGGGEAGGEDGEELDKKALKAKKKAEKIAAAAAEAGGDEDEGNKKSKKDKGGKDAKKDAKQKGKKGGKDDGDAAAAQAPEPVAQAPVAELDDPNAMSMEDRVRKARPKARVQIAESSQPGYVSLRLDDVAVVFRNQEVLKSANWEVLARARHTHADTHADEKTVSSFSRVVSIAFVGPQKKTSKTIEL